MDLLFCKEDQNGSRKKVVSNLKKRRFLPFNDTDAYRTLKVATEAFVMTNCGVKIDTTNANGQDFPEEETEELLEKIGVNVAPAPPTFNQSWNGYIQALKIPHGDESGETVGYTLPYLFTVRDKLRDLPLKVTAIDNIMEGKGISSKQLADLEGNCRGLLAEKLNHPCFLELIWSYWHEESMLVQSLSAITRRFQNIRSPRRSDPLSSLEIDFLQPLNNLLWGYIQDEQHRLTVVRRAYEYDHHYGFSIKGKAIENFRPADSRTRFIESFHQLLNLCAQFYKQEDNTTISADPFPIRNALREVHLILAEGAHNQYGDLPSTARIEMLMQQYILARPELRQYLPTRNMVANPEPWMDRVAAVNKLMGWTDISPINFHNLAVFGEQLLLSIRYGDWADTNVLANQAGIWANFWRQAIQEYTHAYHGVTGVDLAAERTNGKRIDSRPPSYYLAKRLSGKSTARVRQNGRSAKEKSNGKEKVEHEAW